MVEATHTTPAAVADYSKFKSVLKGAVDGQVVTRFPPEPSGYLHIGHIKAAMLNYHQAKMHGGKMILRFDDTNPMNEKLEFQENIMRDLQILKITPDRVTFTSDYFVQLADYMRTLIKGGNAYADDTPAEEMKEQRDEGIESKYRAATVEQNLKLFEDMLSGKTTKHCIRVKLNMQDKVKCLRDPVFFRCKADPHHKTGTTYKAYPTYDLACPIVDSLEGVTHALRTIEYRDRNALYAWVQKTLDIRPVVIFDFAKVNFVSTLLSKRKLKWFVEENHVDGWSDPRFPTVQGIMRRGLTVECLKTFMLEQGPSKNTITMEWDKLWSMNKAIIDPVVPRYTAIGKDSAVKFVIENGPSPPEARSQPLHQKNAELGNKAVMFGRDLWIENDDAKTIEVGQKVTLMKWGNATVTKIETVDGKLVLTGTIDEDDKDFKKTTKLTWICADPDTTVEIKIVEFDHLITKAKVEEEDKVEDLVNKNSKFTYSAIAEGHVRSLQKGSFFQFERRGYYIVDHLALHGKEMVVNFVPDGKSKAMSTVTHAVDAKETAKGKGGVKTGKDTKQQVGREDGKISKKEAAKAAKKEAKAAMKAGGPAPVNPNKGKPKAAANPKFDGIEKQLLESVWIGGQQPSDADAKEYEAIKDSAPNAATHPHTFAWWALVAKFTDAVRASWAAAAEPAAKGKAAGKKGGKKEAAPKEAKKEDDEFDPFAEDGEEDVAAAAALKAKAQAAKDAKPKKVVVAKSIILWEVKPWGEETDLDVLAATILAFDIEGVWWKTQYKKEPIAYGLFKLIIGATVEDDKVSTDDVQERIEQLEDLVQSVDILSFNKV